MLTDEIRSRLEALNRRPLPKGRVDVRTDPPATVPPRAQFHLPGALVGESPGATFLAGAEQENGSGKHWRIEQPLAQFWPGADACLARASPTAKWALGRPEASHPEL